MRQTPVFYIALLVVVTLFGPEAARGQPAVRMVSLEIVPREVRTGDPFTLSTTLRLAPRLMVHVPDTFPSRAGIQSRGPVRWSAKKVAGDSLELKLAYPLLALRPGEVQLPSLGLALAADTSVDDVGSGDARVVAELPERGGYRRHAVQLGSALVAPLLQAGDSLASLAPRAPADVIGNNWSPWVIGTLGLALLTVLAWAGRWLWVWARRRDWRQWARRLTSPSPRRAALRELDEIRGLGLHTNGRIDEFYARTTDVARHFTRQREPTLGASLTSSEWVALLAERYRNGSLGSMAKVVEVAELVKFGRHHPDPSAAESDWAAVRDWIRSVR